MFQSEGACLSRNGNIKYFCLGRRDTENVGSGRENQGDSDRDDKPAATEQEYDTRSEAGSSEGSQSGSRSRSASLTSSAATSVSGGSPDRSGDLSLGVTLLLLC